MLDAIREQEHRRNKFAAGLKGIDLDAERKDEMKSITELALDEADQEKLDLERGGVAVLEGDNW